MSKVILSGYIIVPKHEVAIVTQALATHIELTRREPGCIRFEVNQCAIQQNKFTVYEEFSDSAAFQQHQQRVASSDWGEISRNVERHYKVETLE